MTDYLEVMKKIFEPMPKEEIEKIEHDFKVAVGIVKKESEGEK